MNQPPLNPDALANLRLLADEGTRELRHVVLEPDLLHKLLDIAESAAQPEVTSVEELDALPIGSVIIDKHGDVGLIDRDGTIEKCVQFAETIAMSIGYTAKHFLPARVLYCPEVNDA